MDSPCREPRRLRSHRPPSAGAPPRFGASPSQGSTRLRHSVGSGRPHASRGDGLVALIRCRVMTALAKTPPAARRRIGRYEVLGELAVGGMAEILLGRVVGPAEFERVVVIKRILPHLAKVKTFVDMFVDEARIV